ncbi:MAG: HNH endonuclease [Vulcanibacillus sp.]
MVNAEERLKYFYDNYDIMANYILDGNKKIVLGDKKNQKCRFCGRMASDTKFRMEAHAIPELVGNKILFTNYECDECNQKFSNLLEDHLAAYLSIWRTLMQICGKRGIPKYKKNNSQIYVDESKVNIITYVDNNILQAGEKNRELKIEGTREPYVPIAVYKCFVKMALSIIPGNELSNVNWALEWVGESAHNNSKFNIKPLIIHTAFTPRDPISFAL